MSRKDIENKFFALLKATSLKQDINRPHLYLARSYGSNGLLLGVEASQFLIEAIDAIREVVPKISKETIRKLLVVSTITLFERHNVSEDADPEIAAPELKSILPTLESSTVKLEIDNLLHHLESNVKLWTDNVCLS